MVCVCVKDVVSKMVCVTKVCVCVTKVCVCVCDKGRCVCVCFFQHSFLCLQKVRASQHSAVAMVPFWNPLATASTAFPGKKKVGMSELHCISWRKFKKVWLALPVGGSSALLACLQCMRLGRHVVSCDILQWLSQVVSVQPNAVCSDHPYHCGVAQHP